MIMEFDWVKPKARGKSNVYSRGVRSYRADYRDKSGHIRASTVVRICEETMKRARFVVGDRVQIGVAESDGVKFLAIRRVIDGGFKISSRSRESAGKSLTGHIKMSIEHLPDGEWPLEKITMSDDGMLIMRVSDGKS